MSNQPQRPWPARLLRGLAFRAVPAGLTLAVIGYFLGQLGGLLLEGQTNAVDAVVLTADDQPVAQVLRQRTPVVLGLMGFLCIAALETVYVLRPVKATGSGGSAA